MENKLGANVSNDKDEPSKGSFFCGKTITQPPLGALEAYKKEGQTYSTQELNRIKVFRYIEEHQPITRYRIAKDTGLGTTTVTNLVRDFVFAMLVHEDIRLGANGSTYKILTIPKEKGKDIGAEKILNEIEEESKDE